MVGSAKKRTGRYPNFSNGLLTKKTRLVLTNAVYFKGSWSCTFDKRVTKPDAFTLSDGSQVQVPMMFQEHFLGYREDDRAQILTMDYKSLTGNSVAMSVILPKKKDGLSEIEATMGAADFDRWFPAKGCVPESKVLVYFPKFKANEQFNANDALESLGMKQAFGGGADFSGISTQRDRLRISAVIHKAFVDVNEEGSEAAAATAVLMGRPLIASPGEATKPIIFKADHPFIYMIRDQRSGTILFLGRVTDPR